MIQTQYFATHEFIYKIDLRKAITIKVKLHIDLLINESTCFQNC